MACIGGERIERKWLSYLACHICNNAHHTWSYMCNSAGHTLSYLVISVHTWSYPVISCHNFSYICNNTCHTLSNLLVIFAAKPGFIFIFATGLVIPCHICNKTGFHFHICNLYCSKKICLNRVVC